MIELRLLAIVKYLEHMKSIKDSHEGKKFILDGNTSRTVTIFEILENDFAKIVFDDGTHQSVALGRLKEVVDVPQLQRVSDDKALLEYPQKASKVTIEIFDAEKGEVTVKWLEGEEATKWNDWMRELCYRAEEVGMNPPWLSLKWNVKIPDSYKKP